MSNVDLELVCFVKRKAIKKDNEVVTNYILDISVCSTMNISSIYLPACQLTLELESLYEVNEYVTRITNFYNKFGKIIELEEIEDEVGFTVREKTRLLNRSIASYRNNVKKLLAGTFISDKDYDLFRGLVYTWQMDVIEAARDSLITPTDKIGIHVHVETSGIINYQLVATVYSLFDETEKAIRSGTEVNPEIVWHDLNTFIENVYTFYEENNFKAG
jgi:hypothetical protein